MATAYNLAAELSGFIYEKTHVDYDQDILPVALDIPANIQEGASVCMAFLRIQDPRKNQKFLATCRGYFNF